MTSSQTWHKRLPAAALERARELRERSEAKICMPIKVPDDLPARSILSHEGVHLIKETAALRQDIRALRFLFVNLMPDKIATETQFARLLGNTPLQVEVVLLRTSSYLSKHVSQQHLLDFYREWDDVREEQFDAMIVTGAPVELMEFEDVGRFARGCILVRAFFRDRSIVRCVLVVFFVVLRVEIRAAGVFLENRVQERSAAALRHFGGIV